MFLYPVGPTPTRQFREKDSVLRKYFVSVQATSPENMEILTVVTQQSLQLMRKTTAELGITVQFSEWLSCDLYEMTVMCGLGKHDED
jgi:hypothetical protein